MQPTEVIKSPKILELYCVRGKHSEFFHLDELHTVTDILELEKIPYAIRNESPSIHIDEGYFLIHILPDYEIKVANEVSLILKLKGIELSSFARSRKDVDSSAYASYVYINHHTNKMFKLY